MMSNVQSHAQSKNAALSAASLWQLSAQWL
jgi:hypothetical protein